MKYDRDPDQKVDCFKNKAGLVLDKGYCDNKFPLLLVEDGENVLNERYACYREIQLPGFEKKDVEYCEYVNLADTQAKYDCIDALNQINAGDDAVEECFQQDDGNSNRKES